MPGKINRDLVMLLFCETSLVPLFVTISLVRGAALGCLSPFAWKGNQITNVRRPILLVILTRRYSIVPGVHD